MNSFVPELKAKLVLSSSTIVFKKCLFFCFLYLFVILYFYSGGGGGGFLKYWPPASAVGAKMRAISVKNINYFYSDMQPFSVLTYFFHENFAV